MRSAIEAAVDEMHVPAGAPALVLTGGDADVLAPVLTSSADVRPNLVLEGLRCLVAETSDA